MVTVIDYYSRHQLAWHLTVKYRARDIAVSLDVAHAEAERLHGRFAKTQFLVTDVGSSFLARYFQAHIDGQCAHGRIRYRTPTQVGVLACCLSPDTEGRRGLLESLHEPRRGARIAGSFPPPVQRGPWALVLEPVESDEVLPRWMCTFEIAR